MNTQATGLKSWHDNKFICLLIAADNWEVVFNIKHIVKWWQKTRTVCTILCLISNSFEKKSKQGQQMNWNQIHSALNLTFSIWIKLSKLIPQILPEYTKTNENDTSVSLSHSI